MKLINELFLISYYLICFFQSQQSQKFGDSGLPETLPESVAQPENQNESEPEEENLGSELDNSMQVDILYFFKTNLTSLLFRRIIISLK